MTRPTGNVCYLSFRYHLFQHEAATATNDRSAVQVTGYGTLSESEAGFLTAEEREKLRRH